MILIYSYWNNLYSFSCQDQYITLFLALQEAFKAKPALQSKKQFLNKVTSLMTKGYMISPSLKDEHEVWILYKHCWIGFPKLKKSLTKYVIINFFKSIGVLVFVLLQCANHSYSIWFFSAFTYSYLKTYSNKM